MALTVWSVLWGNKYHPGYVYALKEAVAHQMSHPHEFKCITDQRLDGIETVKPPVKYEGWWQKIGLFSEGIATGPSLYFDLDVVINGPLDYLVEYTTGGLAAPANWAMSGHGGIQSSVLAWSGNWHLPAERIDYERDKDRFWGDQEFLWDLLGDDWTRIPGVVSYKYHCRTGRPETAKVIVFHGKPDPHEVEDAWLLPITATLRSHISANMAHGYKMV